MSRTEDAAVNYILAARPQVLDDEWVRRLGLSRLDIGTSMTDEEVADTSSRLNIEAMLDYRLAVGKRTREVVRQLEPGDLEGRVDKERIEHLLTEGALVEGAYRVAEFWGSGTKLLILNMPATGHAFMHLAEALSIRRELRM
jgi:hypothetical protein